MPRKKPQDWSRVNTWKAANRERVAANRRASAAAIATLRAAHPVAYRKALAAAKEAGANTRHSIYRAANTAMRTKYAREYERARTAALTS